MRILVISDLHANWPALETVLGAEPFDRLIAVGDLVAYGPHPREVVEWVRGHATATVRGNHDGALANGSDCRCAPASKHLAEGTRAVHRRLLQPEDTQFLGSLPQTASLRAADQTFFAVHASPRDHLYRYTLTPQAPEKHIRREVAGLRADYVLLRHTHLPMIRRLGRRTVVNPRSVSQPRDGDPRASYAVIDGADVVLKRIAYDVERTIRDLRALPVPTQIADGLASSLRMGR